jgi:hypothetical protein
VLVRRCSAPSWKGRRASEPGPIETVFARLDGDGFIVFSGYDRKGPFCVGHVAFGFARAYLAEGLSDADHILHPIIRLHDASAPSGPNEGIADFKATVR